MIELGDFLILIPSLQPDGQLLMYLERLVKQGFSNIVIVDDGSGSRFKSVFDQASIGSSCTEIGYEVNQGKGFALKYGLEWILKNKSNILGVITADSDGQHTAEDCIRIAKKLQEYPDHLVLGTRDFGQKDVPIKSRIGNRLTSFFFMLLYGYWLPDTQTGLRGISTEYIPKMLKVPGNRFEYEMNVLIHATNWRMPFEIVPMATIYHNANEGTHFRPLHDSARIYKLLFGNFFKFASAGVLSTLLDHALFNLLERWLVPSFFAHLPSLSSVSTVLTATVVARICSSLFNYRINQRFVFQVQKSKGSLLRYFFLATIVMLLSAFFVESLHISLGMDTGIAKILVDTILFFANYRIMKSWVFKVIGKE
ncbi:MAG: glycosyltransferase [Lentisphaerae bacterium]|nr:glycosyltransferase [Lentisphaerota bacterium]